MTTKAGDAAGRGAGNPATDSSGVPFDAALHRARPGTAFLGLDGHRVDDFWAWAYDNVMTNTNRGVLAEYLVAAALGTLGAPRVEWDAADLRYGDKLVEVKATAYLQSWSQPQLSKLRFSIAPHLPDLAVARLPQVVGRPAHCYVFCLFGPKEHVGANPLDVTTWHFYAVATARLPDHHSLGLTALERLADAVPFDSLRAAVDKELGLS